MSGSGPQKEAFVDNNSINFHPLDIVMNSGET